MREVTPGGSGELLSALSRDEEVRGRMSSRERLNGCASMRLCRRGVRDGPALLFEGDGSALSLEVDG